MVDKDTKLVYRLGYASNMQPLNFLNWTIDTTKFGGEIQKFGLISIGHLFKVKNTISVGMQLVWPYVY